MTPELNPYLRASSAAVEKANRLLATTGSPGYHDLLNMSQELVDQTMATLVDFPGWDPLQIAVLKARAQAAKEFHFTLFNRVNEAIQNGYQETLENVASEANSENAAAKADVLREQMLSKGEKEGRIPFESRVPGSY